MSFELTGRGGDVQRFAYWKTVPTSPEMRALSGFRLTDWSFPSGVTVTLSYRTDGALESVSNNLGRSLSFAHEGAAEQAEPYFFNLRSVSDGHGRTVTYGYSDGPPDGPESMLTQVIQPDGGTWKYRYLTAASVPSGYPADQRPMDFHQLHQVFEPVNTEAHALQFDYDGVWSARSLSDAVTLQLGGRAPWTFLITPRHLGEQVAPNGTSYRTYFDNDARAYLFVDELGHQTRTSYDNLGRVAMRSFPEGNAVRFKYDARSNPIERRDLAKPGSGLADQVATASYPTSCTSAATCNKPLSETDARGNSTSYSWDSTTGLLTQVQAPAAPDGQRPQANYCYSSFGGIRLLTGKVDKVSATQNRITTFAYDTGNQLVPRSVTIDPTASLTSGCAALTKSSALNLSTTFTFDAVGNIDLVDGPRSDVADITNTDFDAMRRPVRTLAPGSQLVRNEYDLNGRLVKVRRARIASPNETTINEADWQTETRTYWPTGVLRESTDAEGNTVAHAYDSLDREVLLTDPDLRRVATVYDAVGRTACTWRGWNSSQPPTSCAWDPASYAANGNRGPVRYVQYSYTANGNRKSVQDANNNLTDYAYDGHDRLTFTLFPDPATGARCSVPATLTSSTTPTCSGEQTYEQSTYDANDNRLTLRTRRADTLSWTYDALNRIQTKAVTGLPTVSYGYNLLNEPTALTSPVLGAIQAHSITYGYDGAGRKTYEENLLGGILGRVGYEYDAAGNRTKTLWPDGYFVSYQYDAANRMQYARENGVQELAFYDYDPLSRRRELRLAGQSSNRITYTYELDSNLDVLTHTLNASSVTLDYGYNKSGQIRTIDANDVFYLPSPSDSSTSFVADKLNRYTSVAGQASSYDDNGNLLTWSPAAGRHTYTYDAENRLRTAAINGSATASIRYDYDPLGRRLSKVVNGITTFYLLDGDEEIAEYNGAGTLLRRFITGPGVDDRIAAVEGNAISSPPKTYYHVNHQGSVIAMSDATGNTSGCTAGINCQRLAYDEYGLLGAGSIATGQPYRYTGRRFDAETGLYYYRARYYSPELGRFLQTDPIGYEDDFNLYAYVGNNPSNRVDPTGEAASLVVVAEAVVIGAAVGCSRSTPCQRAVGYAVVAAVSGAVSYLNQNAMNSESGTSPNSDAPSSGDAPTDTKKRPPNPNGSRGSQEHQDKINDRIRELEGQGHTHEAGGTGENGKKEETVDTAGGYKERRRPDITTTDPNGKPYRENVGRQNKDGTPVSRERKAQEDIQDATGQCAFTPYNC